MFKLIKKNNVYFLECDKNNIDWLKKNKELDLTTIPEPIKGNIDSAKIILLQWNPGSDQLPGFRNSITNIENYIFPKLKKDKEKSLKQEKMEYLFYHLNPDYILTGGFRYWFKIFKKFIKEKKDYKSISDKVCCIEYFPYHSKKKFNKNLVLESQKLIFDKIKMRLEMKNKPLIIIMRGKKEWKNSVPILRKYPINLIQTPDSPQNPVLSKNNFKKEKRIFFEKIEEILS